MQNVNVTRQLIRDIKLNGSGYIKSEIVAKEVREKEPDIHIEYNKEDRTYIATYKKEQ